MNRMTDRCKIITLPQTSFAGGNEVTLKHTQPPHAETLVSYDYNMHLSSCNHGLISFSVFEAHITFGRISIAVHGPDYPRNIPPAVSRHYLSVGHACMPQPRTCSRRKCRLVLKFTVHITVTKDFGKSGVRVVGSNYKKYDLNLLSKIKWLKDRNVYKILYHFISQRNIHIQSRIQAISTVTMKMTMPTMTTQWK